VADIQEEGCEILEVHSRDVRGDTAELLYALAPSGNVDTAVRAYRQALVAAGFLVRFEGQDRTAQFRSLVGERTTNDGELIVSIVLPDDGSVAHVSVVRPQTQPQVLTAHVLRDALASGKPVTLYSVVFDSGSALLTKIGRDQLRQVEALLADQARLCLAVEVHTEVSSDSYFPNSNVDVAKLRADAIEHALGGMGAGRVSVSGPGAANPVVDESVLGGPERNRRVTLSAIGCH
jgi:outer membrane protein OmpA-like peptidoglycan-associated protein